MPFIRTSLARYYYFYTPAYEYLSGQVSAALDKKSYTALKVPRRNKGKTVLVDSEGLRVLTKERNVYQAKLAKDKAADDETLALQLKEEEEVRAGHVFECGCCFDDIPISKMIQCPEAHLFCLECGRRNAENILGNRGTVSLACAPFRLTGFNQFTRFGLLGYSMYGPRWLPSYLYARRI